MDAPRPETVIAIDVVESALDLARAGSGAIHVKDGRDIVTDADVAVEDLIRARLVDAFGWPVIGEERGGEVPATGPHWLVDPICGTRNYASNIPLYAVNVGLVEGDEVTAAVVGDGSSGAVLYAELGGGAWKNGADPQQLTSSDASATVDFGALPRDGVERARAVPRAAAVVESDRWDIRFLATTLSLAYVASGRLAASVLFATPDRVHVAAGTLLVSESGGVVTDLTGRRWTLDSPSIVASASAQSHEDLLGLLA